MHPNVIFLIIDSCSRAQTSLAGYRRDTTPYLRELSSDAVEYPYAFSHSPISGISIGSFMTSSFAFDHKGMPIEVGPSRPSIAAPLREAGYYTALVTANPYYAKKFGYDQGLDEYCPLFDEEEEIKRIKRRGLSVRFFDLLNQIPGYSAGKNLIRRLIPSAYEAGRMKKTQLTVRKSPFGNAEQMNAEMLRVLRERPKDQPLYLQAQYMDLHAPNFPPQEFLERLGSSMSKEQQYLYGQKRSMRPLPSFSEAELEDLKLLHNACLAYVDTRIKEITEELKRQGIYDDTLIIVTADHGEAFFEHGDLGHHALLYEENVRVPLLIKFPRGTGAGTKREEIVNHIDLAPTVADIAGLPPQPAYTGRSLRPDAATGPRDHAISFIAERFSNDDVSRLDFRKFKIALRTKEWKLIVSHNRGDELYSLASDPGEHRNLLQETPSPQARRAYEELRGKLEPYLSRVRA